MKALSITSPQPIENRPLEKTDMPVPEPGYGDIRIRVSVCGACHTDLHIAEGDLPPKKTPVIPGHQIIGHVDKAGPGETGFKQGDRVGVTWLYSSCGQCEFCRDGRENLCDSAQFTGYGRDGGFAEYTVVPASNVFTIPDGFPDIQAAPLLCAGVIGYRSLRLSDIKPGGSSASTVLEHPHI